MGRTAATLLILSLPVLAGALLLLDHLARETIDRDELRRRSRSLRILSVFLAACGVAVIAVMVTSNFDPPQVSALAIQQLVRGLIVGFGGMGVVAGVLGEVRARDVARHGDRSTLRIERLAAAFRVLCWLLLISPATGFAPFLVVLAPMALCAQLLWSDTLSRGRQASLLCRLAIAMEHGLPVADEIESLVWGASRRRRAALVDAVDRLRDGRSLADSLEIGPRLIPRSDVLAIQAAEGSSALPVVLRESATRLVGELRARSAPGNVMAFLVYVMTVYSVMLCILIWMTLNVLPLVRQIFQEIDVPLSAISRVVLSTAGANESLWYLIVPIVTLPPALMLLPSLAMFVGWENLNLAPLMCWFPRRDGPPVLRAVAVAMQSEKPLPETIETLAQHHHRGDVRRRLARVAEAVRQGCPAWEAFRGEGFVGRPECLALESADRAGHLPWALQSLADVIDQKFRRREIRWLEWQRPMMIFSLAAVVGLIWLGVFQPLILYITRLAGGF